MYFNFQESNSIGRQGGQLRDANSLYSHYLLPDNLWIVLQVFCPNANKSQILIKAVNILIIFLRIYVRVWPELHFSWFFAQFQMWWRKRLKIVGICDEYWISWWWKRLEIVGTSDTSDEYVIRRLARKSLDDVDEFWWFLYKYPR